MTSLSPTRADDNRAAAAVNLAARHLAERGAKHVKARQTGGLLVWQVESQTEPGKVYTVTRLVDGWPADTCSCEDHAYRHQTCKHQRAVDLISPVSAPAPVPPTRRPVVRTEWEEEV